MDDTSVGERGPHDEIERLEAQIEAIRSRLESCRKFILAARIAVIGGAILLAAILLGAIAFDQRLLLVAIAALLGGIVVWGSNHSTADQAAAELAKAEADRAALIGRLHLQVVTERPTLH
jgi:cell division protein FtsB